MVIASFFYGWFSLNTSGLSEGSVFISVIIPVRNEEYTIHNLLDYLKAQLYPPENLEIILVDDHCTDKTIEIAGLHGIENLKIFKLPESTIGKKAALTMGIRHSKGELILTTDADCQMGCNWLRSISSYYTKYKPVMILSPVIPMFSYMNGYKRALENVLALEMYSLLGVTAGSTAINQPVMCNGANLAFAREALQDIEQTYTASATASGDDMFGMMELKKKYPGKVHFIKSKEASVYTHIVSGVRPFLMQRGRWASKARFYRDPTIVFTALTVFITNVMLLLALLYGIFNHQYTPFVLLLAMKSAVDFPLLYGVTSFFNKKKLMYWFPVAQSFYFIYVCIAVLYGTIMPNVWKGRRI